MSPPSLAIPAALMLPPTQAGIARAVKLLDEGKLVVLPTETVYGIAVNLQSPQARQDVRTLKERLTESKMGVGQWVIHAAAVDDVLSWAPHLSAMGRRLVSKSLPGPVAFQIKLGESDLAAARARLGEAAHEALTDGHLTLRVPDLAVTQQVLAEARAPVAIVGAGTPSQPGIFEAAELPAGVFSDAPAVQGVMDAGQTRYRRSSTLVRIEGDSYSVVRAGVIDARIIDRFADFTILFVCTGNTCRSPMAAAVATRILADKLGIHPEELPLRHVVIQSAGIHAARGMRAPLEAMEAVKAYGAELHSHFSQPLTVDLLRRADVVYTMTDAHREEVLDLMPGVESRTSRLDPDSDIADPIGAGQSVYEQVAESLATVLRKRLDGLPV